METFSWNISKDKAAIVIALLDYAVRQGGLEVAEKALPLAKELTGLVNGKQPESDSDAPGAA